MFLESKYEGITVVVLDVRADNGWLAGCGFLVPVFFTATQLERVHGNQGSSVNKRRASRNENNARARKEANQHVLKQLPNIIVASNSGLINRFLNCHTDAQL